MITLLLRLYRDKFLSRWTVLFFDLTATLLALIASIALRFNFSVDQAQRVLNIYSFIAVLALYSIAYLFIGSYKGILRHTSLEDVTKVLKSTSLGFTVGLFVTIFLQIIGLGRLFPISILSFHFALSTLALIGLRLVAKSIYIAGTHQKTDYENVLIFGSGDSGIMTKNALQQEQKGKYRIVAFADDNANRWDKKLQDIPILSPNKALDAVWLTQNSVKLVVIAIQTIAPLRRNEISEAALQAGIKVKVVPFGSGAQMVQALMAGKIDATLPNVSEATNQVADGTFRALVVLAEKRLKDYPNVPSSYELGIKAKGSTTRGYAVLASTPKPIIEKIFKDHPGNTKEYWFATEHEDVVKLLNFFIKEKSNLFGDYEDAVDQKDNILFHSALSPYINLGLITPEFIVQKVLDFHHKHKIRLNSLEGYIRQVIGWREFMRGIYQSYSDEMETGNFFKHNRKMKKSWNEGSTGLPPLDHAINNAKSGVIKEGNVGAQSKCYL